MTGNIIRRSNDSNYIQIYGGDGWNKGAQLTLNGNKRDVVDDAGSAIIATYNDQTGSFHQLKFTTTGNLLLNSKSVDIIEEQGTGYIRYSNGIQICWGIKNFPNLTFSDQWGDSVLLSPELTISYSKTFTSNPPACSLFMMSGWASWVTASGESSTSSTVYFRVARPKGSVDSSVTNAFVNMSYVAIGRWK